MEKYNKFVLILNLCLGLNDYQSTWVNSNRQHRLVEMQVLIVKHHFKAHCHLIIFSSSVERNPILFFQITNNVCCQKTKSAFPNILSLSSINQRAEFPCNYLSDSHLGAAPPTWVGHHSKGEENETFQTLLGMFITPPRLLQEGLRKKFYSDVFIAKSRQHFPRRTGLFPSCTIYESTNLGSLFQLLTHSSETNVWPSCDKCAD